MGSSLQLWLRGGISFWWPDERDSLQRGRFIGISRSWILLRWSTMTSWVETGVAAIMATSLAPSTKRLYCRQWRKFDSWCASSKYACSGPPNQAALAAYLRYLRTQGLHEPMRELAAAAVLVVGRSADSDFDGPPNPDLEHERKLNYVTEEQRHRPIRPMYFPQLAMLVDSIGTESLVDVRDCALVLLSWWAGLQPEEVASLRWCDVREVPGGIRLSGLAYPETIDRMPAGMQNTDAGVPLIRAIPDQAHCAVAALKRWQRVSRAKPGVQAPIFTSSRRSRRALAPMAIGRMFRIRATAAGLGVYTFSNLREGFICAHLASDTDQRNLAYLVRLPSTRTLKRFFKAELIQEPEELGITTSTTPRGTSHPDAVVEQAAGAPARTERRKRLVSIGLAARRRRWLEKKAARERFKAALRPALAPYIERKDWQGFGNALTAVLEGLGRGTPNVK